MKEMMKPHTCEPNRISSALAMHKGSHVISKFQPKIRIVHVFAPEIIKTDVANFRELVQRLTGKPPDHKRSNKKKAKSVISREESLISSFKPTKTRDLQDGSQRIKEEEEEREMWGGENSTTGFFSGFGDLDSFIQGLSEFPLLPSNSSHMDMLGLGESHLS
ncbi:VQ motif-containing protein 25-like isoform X1 [Macadamia integrifolia]|uniref:VQ motif-containing protein 25-like isoform X1 n=1 Tax=Macadamia integrifolia TaxID=60698 RepID=UPI001C52D896|nr:VQ motif-containing protein 25-like isoform X1 [Macadamia integrifolia]